MRPTKRGKRGSAVAPANNQLARWARIDGRAKRHRRRGRPVSFAALRIAELTRLLAARYGDALPPDDAGSDDARIMVHHLAQLSTNQRRRIGEWLDRWAPWMPPPAARELTEAALSKPIRWRADTLGARLRLTAGERKALHIRTIGDIETTAAERLARRREQSRRAKARKRKEAGAVSRSEYLAACAARTKPWERLGVSRRTWFRKRGPKPVR
jgi:hypothetical protein